MKHGYIRISKGNTWINFYISGGYFTEDGFQNCRERGYSGYSIREALRLFKAENGLKYKRNITIYNEL